MIGTGVLAGAVMLVGPKAMIGTGVLAGDRAVTTGGTKAMHGTAASARAVGSAEMRGINGKAASARFAISTTTIPQIMISVIASVAGKARQRKACMTGTFVIVDAVIIQDMYGKRKLLVAATTAM
jgi:hypothetical protein